MMASGLTPSWHACSALYKMLCLAFNDAGISCFYCILLAITAVFLHLSCMLLAELRCALPAVLHAMWWACHGG